MTKPIIHLLLCHEPESPGFIARNGVSERALARDINSFTFNRLNRYKCNVWLHEQDTLAARIKYLKRAAAQGGRQVVVETHLNAFPDPEVRGYMTLAHAKSPQGMKLATCIQQHVELARPGATNLGVCGCDGELRYAGTDKEFRQTRLALLEDTKQWAVIPEPVTLSNEQDLRWITKFDNRKALGYAICQGIVDFINSLTLEV